MAKAFEEIIIECPRCGDPKFEGAIFPTRGGRYMGFFKCLKCRLRCYSKGNDVVSVSESLLRGGDKRAVHSASIGDVVVWGRKHKKGTIVAVLRPGDCAHEILDGLEEEVTKYQRKFGASSFGRRYLVEVQRRDCYGRIVKPFYYTPHAGVIEKAVTKSR